MRRLTSQALGLVTLAALFPPLADAAAGRVASSLLRRADEGCRAFISGDMRRWLRIVSPIAEDFTLMQPSGGISRGFEASDQRLDALAHLFKRGTATLEPVETYVVRDMAVLVFIERQRATVGELPEQDWSLRVTQVYRRRGRAWELVHRHADALVGDIGLERTADLARMDVSRQPRETEP